MLGILNVSYPAFWVSRIRIFDLFVSAVHLKYPVVYPIFYGKIIHSRKEHAVKKNIFIFLFCAFFCVAAYSANPEKPGNSGLNISQIEQLTGAKGQLDPKEKVFKVSIPRDDAGLAGLLLKSSI